MKNFFKFNLLYLVTLISITIGFISCSSDSLIDNQPITENYSLSTRCLIGTDSTGLNTVTAVSSAKYSNALINSTYSDAYYFIRIDNRIPGCGSFNSSLYFPQNQAGGSIFSSLNKGALNQNSVSDWSYGTGNITYYLYDTSGKESVKPLVDVPSINDLINAHKNTKYNISNINTDTLKVIWYIAKLENNVWHVDGVLTGKSTKDITEIPGIDEDKDKENKKDTTDITPVPDIKVDSLTTGHVEVDIHQQEHQTWDEIKTSIHIRDLVDSVTVKIPISTKYICENDDMAIRYYEYFDSYDTSKALSYVQVKVLHTTDTINITVKVNPEYIDSLLKVNGDGLTVEIHNYVKDLSDEELWMYLKESDVKTYKKTLIKGQITSAYFEDKKKF